MSRHSYFCGISSIRTTFKCSPTVVLLRLLVLVLVVKEHDANKTEYTTVYLRSGQDFKLPCDTKALKNVTLIIWKRQNETLRSINPLINVDTHLHLTNVSVGNSGVYSCIVYSLNVPFLNLSKEVVVQVDLLTVNQTHVSVIADHKKLQAPVDKDASSLCSTGVTLFDTILHGQNLNRYVVSVIGIGKPTNFSPIDQSILPITNTSKQVMVIGPLKPYTKYRLSFTFGSDTLKSPVTHLNVTTSEGVPDPPVALNGFTTDDSVTLTWSNGLENGRLTRYKLELYRCTGEEEMTVPKSSLRLRQAHISPLRKQYTFDNLDPNTCFAARVAAATKVGLGNFSSLHQLYTDLPAPSPPHLVSVSFTKSNNILVNWTCSQAACATTLSSPPSTIVGTTEYYTVCWSLPVDKVVPIGRHYQTPKCINAETFPASLSRKTSNFCTCLSSTLGYQAVRLPWSTVHNSRSDRAMFSVRSGIKRKFCCTEAVCKSKCLMESSDSNVISLDLAGVPGYWRPTSHFQLDETAIGGITAVIAVIFLSVLLVACFPGRILALANPCWNSLASRRRSQKTVANSCSSVSKLCRPAPLRLNKPSFKPIPRNSLHDHVASLHANDGAGFQAEFEAIDLSTSADLSSHSARLPENIGKNRYSNVLACELPDDHTRVLLHDISCKTDYINANFVDGYFHRSAYIATQGPIASTFDDFWSMVWEQDCNVIVMISNFIERGRRKCDQYWPSGGCQVYGNISVRMLSETVRAFFTTRLFGIRHVKCKRNSKERVLFHYQYTDWRDFDVPSTPLPVIKFIENSIAQWSTGNGPIIVHCSAGVGRTGTYICIDSLIQQLRVERCASVRAFLEHIRQQRMKLVQTEMCIGSRVRNVDSSSVRTVTSNPGARNSTTTASMSSVNWWWNASDSLAAKSSPMLHGHYSLCEYHVARHPTSKTETADFWRMVWEENSPVVICLLTDKEKASSTEPAQDVCHLSGDDCLVNGSDPQSQRCQPVFWPSDGQQVSFVHSTALSPWLTRLRFLLTSDREDYALSCTLWLFTAWPSDSLERATAAAVGEDADNLACGEQLLQLVTKCGAGSGGDGTHDLPNDEEVPFSSGASGQGESVGPVVVVDSCDGHRAGIFCALRIAIHQLLDEGYIDIYFVFKMICQQQPGIFRSYHDFELIYTLMQQYVRHHLRAPQTSAILPVGSTSVPGVSASPHQNLPSGGGLAHLLGLPVKPQSAASCRQDTRSPVGRSSGKPVPRGHCRNRVSPNPETSPLLAPSPNHTEATSGHSSPRSPSQNPVVSAVVSSMPTTAPSLQSSQHSSLYSLARAYLCNSAYSVNSHQELVDDQHGSPLSTPTAIYSPVHHLPSPTPAE